MLINLTPHDIKIQGKNGSETIIERSGTIARVETESRLIMQINGIPVYSTDLKETVNLPEQKKGYYYIVSNIVKQQYPDRHDLLYPTKLVRDEEGRIVACEGLSL